MRGSMADEIIKAVRQRFRVAPFLIGIDGRSAAGKTTLALDVASSIDCEVIHLDDFFLRPQQVSAERLAIPGENIDHERVIAEVMKPIKRREPFCYRPYDCKKKRFSDEVFVPLSPIYILEGSYALCDHLLNYYDLKVFLDIDAESQRERIMKRNGAEAQRFFDHWIPLEEKYFRECDVMKRADLISTNSSIAS